MISIGDIINDRYRIIELLGSGGMADVYSADDFIANRLVAIKIMKENLLSQENSLDEFKNEVNITASMSHPNIVNIYNEGMYKERPYLVIEYVKGQTLSDKLDFLTKFTVDEAVSIMIQLLDALEYTHQHKLIHRDVKPQNIFYFSNGTIKLGDFGIAKNEKTLASKVVGSIFYLAPEVISGSPFSTKSDIYAAGITFFELLTGRVPFEGNSIEETAKMHLKEKMPIPSSLIFGIPNEIDSIVLKATSKNPNSRYRSCMEFKNELIAFKNGISKKESLFSKILKNI